MDTEQTKTLCGVRDTADPFIACRETQPQKIFDGCYEQLCELGKTSIPRSVALTMHTYVLMAIAMYPISRFHPYFTVRKRFLARILKERALVANTTLSNLSDAQSPAVLEDSKTGPLLSGRGRFMSLATVADYALVSASSPNGQRKQLCVVPLKNNPAYTPGELVFTGSMAESDTRSVVFDRSPIEFHVAPNAGDENDASSIAWYQQACFQALATAPYVGGISALIDRIYAGLKHGKGKPNDQIALTEQSLGRARLKLYAAQKLSSSAGRTLCAYSKGRSVSIDRFYEDAAAAKTIGFELAEEAVDILRKTAGLACIKDPENARILSEIHYGRLHPAPEASIEHLFFRTRCRPSSESSPELM